MKKHWPGIVLACVVASPVSAQWAVNGAKVGDEAWRRSDGDLSAMLVLTRQPEAFLESWSVPPSDDYVPEIRAAHEVFPGEKLAAFVLFTGCTPSQDGRCESDVSFTALKPDGAPYADTDVAELWHGPAPVGKDRLQLGVGYFVVIIEPTDPLGDYTVNAKVCDKVKPTCLDLSQAFNAHGLPAELDLDEFMEHYYQEPRPALVDAAILELDRSDVAHNESAVPPTASFFGAIFHDNPDLLPHWTELLDERDHATRAALLKAVALSKNLEWLVETSESSPSVNDMLWGAFLATGDTRYVDAVARRLSSLDERDDLNLFLTAASAQWSLASNARQHPRVARRLQELADSAVGQEKAALNDVIQLPPQELRERMVEVVKQQHHAGVW